MPACPASFLKKDSRSPPECFRDSVGMTNYVVLLMNFLITLSTARKIRLTVTSKSTPICHSRKRSASEILLRTKKDSGQAGMTDKKLKTKKRLLQQRASFNNDMTVDKTLRNLTKQGNIFQVKNKVYYID
jgi:hypothetical protein